MARTTPVNSGYTIINGTTTGSNGANVDTWVEYKVLAQSVQNNTSTVRVVLYSQSRVSSSTRWDVAENFGYVGYNNSNRQYLSTTYDFSDNKINKFGDYTFTIAHNSSGAKTITIQGAWSTSHSTYISGGSVSGSVTLPTIPRYATVNQNLVSKTETTATIKWTSDSIIDYIWYSTNNGSSWTGIDIADATGGTYTISGLSADTSYQIKTRVRRKDSQLTTDSSALSVKTYAFPFANSMPSFTIGSKLTIGLFNPLGRQVTVSIIGADNSQISSDTTTGTSIAGYTGSAVVNALYNSIPSAQSGTYKVKVTYGTNISTKTGGTYKVNPNVCSPSIGSVAYEDRNATTIALTGNNQDIVRNHSTLSYSASGLTAKNGASVSACSVTVNGQTIGLSVSGSNANGTGGVIDSGMDVNAVFTVTDSRGLTGTKTVKINMLDWSAPSAIINVQRQDNFYTKTYLTVDARYASINGNNQITITYQATKEGDSSPTYSGTLQDNVTIELNLDNNYAWTVVVTLVDSLNGTTTYSFLVSRGMPIIYFDRLKSSVGVNCFPKKEKSLEVNGYDVTFHDGESVTLDGFFVGGILTNSGNRLQFSIPLPKFIPNLNVAVTGLKINVWIADGGYAIGNSYVTGGYNILTDNTITVTTTIATGNMLNIRLDKTSEFNGTNNTPISVQINELTLSFSS